MDGNIPQHTFGDIFPAISGVLNLQGLEVTRGAFITAAELVHCEVMNMHFQNGPSVVKVLPIDVNVRSLDDVRKVALAWAEIFQEADLYRSAIALSTAVNVMHLELEYGADEG